MNNNNTPLISNTSQFRRKEIIGNLKRCRYLYLLIFLPVVYFVLFKYIPIYGVLIAFKNYDVFDGILGSPWVGLENFKAAFTDPEFWPTVKNTFLLSFYSILFGFPIPVIMAILINELRSHRTRRLIESVFCFPHFISMVVVVSILMNFLEQGGLVNHLIMFLGGNSQAFMLDPKWFRTVYVLSDIWKDSGWNSIIYLAALSAVDVGLYEACDIDGGGRLSKILHVSLPSITPTIIIMFILRIGSVMSLSFEKVLLMQNPVTYSTSDIIDTFVFRRGLVGFQFSYATAVGVFQSVIGLIFILSANSIARKVNETSLW